MGPLISMGRKAKECPLCGLVVSGGADGMDRHTGADCPWRDRAGPAR